MTCHSYKKCVSFLRLDLNKLFLPTLMWIFILKDLRNYFFYRTIPARTTAAATEQQQQIHKNSSNYTINNKNESDSNIRNTSNSKNNSSNSHNDDNSDSNYSKNDNKNNYTSGRNAEYLYDDRSGRSCKDQIVIHLNLETLYLRRNLSTHDFFGKTPLYNVFLEYLQIK